MFLFNIIVMNFLPLFQFCLWTDTVLLLSYINSIIEKSEFFMHQPLARSIYQTENNSMQGKHEFFLWSRILGVIFPLQWRQASLDPSQFNLFLLQQKQYHLHIWIVHRICSFSPNSSASWDYTESNKTNTRCIPILKIRHLGLSPLMTFIFDSVFFAGSFWSKALFWSIIYWHLSTRPTAWFLF